ncbi:hypothetical protein D9M68_19120 [compost metagenome]
MNTANNREPETVEELKEVITKLAIETGQGLWKTVSFEDIGRGRKHNDDGWCASESAIGSGHREIIYCGVEGLKNSYKELVEYKRFIDSGEAARFRLNSSGRSAKESTGDDPLELGEL